MSDFQWTDPQRLAIDARGDILVSAAAGSGKTAVLVQRVIEMIEQECDVDEMLIVTFTRTAAAQMKEKIADAIAARLQEQPLNARFKKQQLLLDKAMITTIDAFCADIIKNNFHHLKNADISLNYSYLDAAQFAVLSKEVLDEVLEEFYDSGEQAFLALMDVFTSGKNDTNIYAVMDTLHQYTSAFADKQAWMQSKAQLYLQNCIAASDWGKLLLKVISESYSLAIDYLQKGLELLREDEATDAVYGEALRADRQLVQSCIDAAEAGLWQELCQLSQGSFERYPSVKKNMDLELKAQAKIYRDAAGSVFKDTRKYLVESEEEFAADNQTVYPIVCMLSKLLDAYEQRLFQRKQERQSYEFSDISALALELLADENGEPSEIAREYRQKFKAIFVDEYQDTNDVQDCIFRMLSRNNLFVVGDVKQSIYRFRQAMPEIFIRKRKSLPPYERGKNSGYVLLKNNFRSEKPITDFVNYLFTKLMSEELGEVDYNEDECLIPRHSEPAPAPELHILENHFDSEGKKPKSHYYEAGYIADLIRRQVESGEEMTIDGQKRPLTYGDFCVLVRAKTHLPDLEKAFEEAGVPCLCNTGEQLFDAPEIMLVMSLLRAIDNPLRDVDLLAVMYSEIFGFSADELALIRIGSRKGNFYAAVAQLAEQGNEKCARFVQTMERYRTAAAILEPSEFLRQLFDDNALPALLGVGADGALRRANLYKFLEVVKLYSSAGYYGLTGLVRFLEKVKENGSDITTAYMPQAQSKVQVMSVHASKGLEFPVVIFAFSNQSNHHTQPNIVLNREYGIGIKPKDIQKNARFDSIAFTAVNTVNMRDDIAEELRTLYVALTRAKTKLIITGTFDPRSNNGVSQRQKQLDACALLSSCTDGINKGWMRRNNNFFLWLIACAFLHPDSRQLRAAVPQVHFCVDEAQSGSLKTFMPAFDLPETAAKQAEYSAQPDAALLEQLRERFAFTYAYEGAQRIDSKTTPSALAQENETLYSFEAPEFLSTELTKAAHRGTATHRFMEKVNSFSDFDYEKELAAMLQKGFLSEEQAQVMDEKAIKRFFNSPLAKRMARSERLEKEYPVSYLEYAGFFDESLPENVKNEKVFVDGMLDAVFVENGKAVIVDYKTDHVKTASQLIERYHKQLELYKRAIEAVWGMEVAQCHIYSFALNEDILVAF